MYQITHHTEESECAHCGAPLYVSDTVYGFGGEAYCSPECLTADTDPVTALTLLAAHLPAGLPDPDAYNKMHREVGELVTALRAGDTLGAVLEAADCAYYAVKCEYGERISPTTRDELIAVYARLVGLTPTQVLTAAIAKYMLRAGVGNPKNDQAERAAVQRALEATDGTLS